MALERKKKNAPTSVEEAEVVNLSSADRDAKIDELVDKTRKLFGNENMGTLRGKYAMKEAVKGVFSTGSMALNHALGVGGVPRGRIVEIFGGEGGGKTTLALQILAEAQKAGGIVAFVDAEHAIDTEYASRLGIDVDRMLFSQPDTGEQSLEIVRTLVLSGKVDAIVVDSVAALVPKAELEGSIGDSAPGAQARMMSQALRILTGAVEKSNTLVIFINQTREKIGVMFGSPKTTSGGNALKFYASVRLEVSRIGQLKKNETVFGNRVKVAVVKNKVAPPFCTAEFDLVFGEGIAWASELLDLAAAQGLIKKAGAWYSYGDERMGQGRDFSTEWLKERPDVVAALRPLIKMGG